MRASCYFFLSNDRLWMNLTKSELVLTEMISTMEG